MHGHRTKVNELPFLGLKGLNVHQNNNDNTYRDMGFYDDFIERNYFFWNASVK